VTKSEVRSRKSEVTVEIRSSFPRVVISLEDCDLALEEADAAVGQEIHRGRQRDHDQREWRVNECHRNGRDIDDNRDKIFARHSPVQPLEFGFVMMAADRRAQKKEGKRARS